MERGLKYFAAGLSAFFTITLLLGIVMITLLQFPVLGISVAILSIFGFVASYMLVRNVNSTPGISF